jgi:hypothetical protein
MPGHMDKGTKKYRNMMKNMETKGTEMMSDVFSPMMRGKGSGVTTDAEFKAYQDALKGSAMAGMDKMAGMDSMLDTEKESMMKMLQGMDFAPSDVREAIEALMSMGFDRDAVLEILESTPGLIGNISNKEQVMPKTMTEGALGALDKTPKPMMRPTPMPERLDADRTQSMDMQKTGMGT